MAGRGEKKGFHLHVTSRFEDEWETSLRFGSRQKKRKSGKAEIRMEVCTLSPISRANLEEFDDREINADQ